jgi:hypothetical protein
MKQTSNGTVPGKDSLAGGKTEREGKAMTATPARALRAIEGLVLLAAGAALLSVPFIGILLGLLLLLMGASITCEYALSIEGPKVEGGSAYAHGSQ